MLGEEAISEAMKDWFCSCKTSIHHIPVNVEDADEKPSKKEGRHLVNTNGF